MKSIQRRFLAVEKKNPLLSSYLVFYRAIAGQSFTKSSIQKWFNKLVDKNDFSVKQKRCLIRSLTDVSKSIEDTINLLKIER